MTSWLVLLLLVTLALGVVRLAGLRGPWFTMTVSALLLGAAGYALQGSPGLKGASRAEAAKQPPVSLVAARSAFIGQFNRSSHWLIISDSYAARGNTRDAVGILQAATRQHPRDYALWLGLGNALADHAQQLTPAARLAYARSAELAPASPAPAYFLGLAMLRSGDPEGALEQWTKILADAPANASWRPRVEEGVALIESSRRPR